MKEGVTKEQFIKELENVLKLTRESVSELRLVDDETVAIIYKDGTQRSSIKLVDIAIIRDVAKSI